MYITNISFTLFQGKESIITTSENELLCFIDTDGTLLKLYDMDCCLGPGTRIDSPVFEDFSAEHS